MFVKYFELFRSERPDELIYNLSQLMALIRIVTIVLGDSDPFTTGIKCHFLLFIFFLPPFYKNKNKRRNAFFTTRFTLKEKVNGI